MSMEVPKIENGVKVGVAYTVERHQCGECSRAETAAVEKRRAIAAGISDAHEHLDQAVRTQWGEDQAEPRHGPSGAVPRTYQT
jgi:hypothetical protein